MVYCVFFFCFKQKTAYEMRISDWSSDVCSSDLVSDVLKLLAERRIGAVPVMDGDTVVGVFSERDIIYGLAQDGPPILDRRVDQMMTAPAVTVTRDQTALSALGLITRRRSRHLPGVENGRLIGIVPIGDPVKRRVDGIERGDNR